MTGSYKDPAGNPAPGVVLFTPGSAEADATGHLIVTGTTVTCHLVSGAFSVVLPCTDATTLAPVPFYYSVVTAIAGVSNTPFTISLPSSLGTTVDMSALSPTPILPMPASGVYVISVNGQSGAVTVTEIGNVTVTGTPSPGQVLTATSATTATWQ